MQPQHPSADLITLPLLKFSHAEDTAAEVQKFSWRHVTQDLVLVFDTFRGPGREGGKPSQMMKVLQGTKVLESIDFKEKIDSCDQVVAAMRQHNVQVRAEQLPISGLVKCPLFAIRYNLADRKVRRIQLKFASNQDFDIAHDHLSRLGLRITQSMQPTANSTISSSSAVPENREPSLKSTPSSNQQQDDKSGRSFISPPQVSTGQATTDSHFNADFTNVRRPNTMDSVPVQRAPVANMLGQTSYQRDGVSQPHGQQSTHDPSPFARPVSAYSMTTNHSHNREVMPLPSEIRSNPHSEPFTSSVYSSTGSAIPPHYSSGRIRDPRTSMQAAEPERPNPSGLVRDPRFSNLAAEENRPISSGSRPPTSLSFQSPDTALGPLPPRRELPFKRSSPPISSGTDQTKTTGRPSSALREAVHRPPSGRPERPLSSALSSSTFDLPPLPQPTIVSGSGRRPSKVSGTIQDSAFSSNRPFSPLTHSAQNAQRVPPVQRSRIPDPSHETNENAFVDRTAQQINSERARGDDLLASYASQSVDERSQILNDFMLRHIEDDNFLTLCEDISACWRRIVLEND